MSGAEVLSRAEHEALLAEAIAKRDEAIAEQRVVVEEQRDKIEHLEYVNEKLQHLLYGRKTEKPFIDSETGAFQAVLFDDEEEPAPEPAKPPNRKKAGRRRPRFGRNVERVVIEQTLDGEDRQCTGCGEELRSIGVERSEKFDFIPASVRVLEIHRHKYACPRCKRGGVKAAPTYPTAFAKSAVTDETRAHFVVQKFVDHLPYYRLSSILERSDIHLSDDTIGRYVLETADLVEPIVWAMRAELLASNYLQVDETTLPVLKTERAQPGAHRAYLWTYGIPWSTVVFDYQLTRSGQHAADFLEQFQGILQSDRYAGYKVVRQRDDIVDVACWSHARRKFKEAERISGRRSRPVLALIGKLYGVEKTARERKMDSAARAALRQEYAAPVLAELREELARLAVTVRPSTPLGKAVDYTLGSWTALTRYVELGQVEIDSNLLENSIRPVALGRKNYIFAGSPAGAAAAATLYSITETCRRIGVNPFTYLTELLRRLATEEWTEELVLSLTPVRWAAERSARPATQ